MPGIGAPWFFVPAVGLESWTARWRVLVRWTFATPTWPRDEPTAWRLFVAWRVALLAGVASFFVLLGSEATLAGSTARVRVASILTMKQWLRHALTLEPSRASSLMADLELLERAEHRV